MSIVARMRKIFQDWKWRRAFARLPEPKTAGDLVVDEGAVLSALAASPVPVRPFFLDVDDFAVWRRRAAYDERHPGYYRHNLLEKSLEHYVAATFLRLGPGMTYLDVASESATAAEVYERLYQAHSIALDLSFAPGLHGSKLGCNADAIPLSDHSIDAMALHCSFEHFEGDSDMGFIREAARLLRPGGRCVIAPLYLCQYYACLTDPLVAGACQAPFDPEARIVALRGWNNRHGRFYDVDRFVRRVWANRGSLDVTLYHLENRLSAGPACYLRFFAVLEQLPARAPLQAPLSERE